MNDRRATDMTQRWSPDGRDREATDLTLRWKDRKAAGLTLRYGVQMEGRVGPLT